MIVDEGEIGVVGEEVVFEGQFGGAVEGRSGSPTSWGECRNDGAIGETLIPAGSARI